jgi:hypothetical protein
MMKVENPESTIGLERFRSDRRQLGGLLLVMGMCVTFQPVAGIASLIGVNQDASRTAVDSIWLICCGIIQIIFGTLAMVTGYLGLVHDFGNRRLTGALLLITLLSCIPFVTGIIEVGIAASPPYIIETRVSSSDGIALLEDYVVNPFVPEDYLPNKTDVIFLGCMGILGLISYGIGFFGSLAFLGFALYTFDAGKPSHRDAKYYRGRLLFYSFVMLIAGMNQILLGAYVLFEFGGGPLSPPVGVAMYRVSFPEITLAVGSIQMIVGYYGVGNYLNLFPVGPNNNRFQILAMIGWLLQFILQYIVQISYVEGNEISAALPSLVLYSFGMNILPPFLDYKMRTTPTSLNDYYYGTINKDNKIGVGICADLASLETPTRPGSCEKDSLVDNMKALEIRSGSEYHSDFHHKKLDKCSNESGIVVEETTEFPNEPGIDMEETAEHFGEPGITVEEIVEYPNEFGMTFEETVEFPVNDTVDQFPESGIIVEECVEYPDELSQENIFKGRTREEVGDDNDSDDQDTLPRSNESFTTDMEDTWGDQARQQSFLSPIEEEDSRRMLFGEQTENGSEEGHKSSSRREPINPPRDFDAEDQIQELENFRSKTLVHASTPVMNPGIPDSYYDYDTDEGFEISEATPDDDTAALDAKIEKLKGELISDTNLESYLNQIL